uniref:N-lysine methyltransferase KMT5A-like n=1 Tax=Maylandia zebra TaxID=106582 RepID=UPI000D315959|nr:N-lysine methyltransferase KMT5A-like [Maylandia zebra]
MSTAIRRRIKNTKPIVQENMRRRRIPPREDAVCHVSAGRDKLGLDIHYINAFKGRGIFTTVPFQKGDFLLEYRGKLITKEECERRHRVYHDSLKVFMFEFKFDGKLWWCVLYQCRQRQMIQVTSEEEIPVDLIEEVKRAQEEASPEEKGCGKTKEPGRMDICGGGQTGAPC